MFIRFHECVQQGIRNVVEGTSADRVLRSLRCLGGSLILILHLFFMVISIFMATVFSKQSCRVALHYDDPSSFWTITERNMTVDQFFPFIFLKYPNNED